VSFWQIYRKVWLTAVLWGAGTAVGEVPPYFLSYQAAVAGTRNDMLQDVQENMHTGGWVGVWVVLFLGGAGVGWVDEVQQPGTRGTL